MVEVEVETLKLKLGSKPGVGFEVFLAKPSNLCQDALNRLRIIKNETVHLLVHL